MLHLIISKPNQINVGGISFSLNSIQTDSRPFENNWKLCIYLTAQLNVIKSWIYFRSVFVSIMRNVTKSLHVPKREIRPKCVFASNQWNVRKLNKESTKLKCYPTIKEMLSNNKGNVVQQ